MPAVRSRLAEWPYPVALDAPPDAELGAAATRPGAASRPPPEPPAAEAEARPAAGLGTLIPRGTLVWAKHGSDGLWHRGMVQTPVDHDCYLVQFTERNCVDIVWHDGLRPYGPPGEGGGGEGGGGEGGGGGVILGFGKDDMQASSPVKDGSIERKRSVRWSDSLSSHGGSDKGDGARRGAGGKTESMSGHTVIASSTNASSRDVSRAVSEVGGDPYLVGSGRAALSGLPPLGPIGGGGGALPEQQRGGRGADGVPQLAVSTARSSGGGGSKACVIL